MKLGLSLFVIYVIGKLIAVAVHSFELGLTSVPVLFWQDILCAAIVAGVYQCSKRAGWVLYGIAVAHFAVSMPLLRLMATPLTVPLLNAGSGTLADSMAHHLDTVNLALLAGTLLLGGGLPFVLRRMPDRLHPAMIVFAGALALAGYLLTGSSDLQGLHRNSVAAFVRSIHHSVDAGSIASFVGHERHSNSSYHELLDGANVILIGLESTGTKHLSTYAAETDPMPFLSRLASEGIVFENVYAPYPESIKGLAALLFSRQPRFGFDPEELGTDYGPSLARVATESGYQAALFHSGRFMYLGMDNVVDAAGFHCADDAGTIGGNHNSSFGVDDFSTVEHLLNWLDARTNSNPFLVQYLPIAGHHPYEAPLRGPFGGGSDACRYLNALHYSDLALKKLVEGIRKRGLLENTLLVIYGDHGEAFGEHPGNYGHTLYLYEENVRVPLIFWMPAKLQPARLGRVTSLVDVAPTVCDLLGFSAPASFEGASALCDVEAPAFFSTEYSMRLRGVRFRDWKLIYENDTGHSRLYDLKRDPAERLNVAAVHAQVVSSLRRFFEWSEGAPPSTMPADPETLAQR